MADTSSISSSDLQPSMEVDKEETPDEELTRDPERDEREEPDEELLLLKDILFDFNYESKKPWKQCHLWEQGGRKRLESSARRPLKAPGHWMNTKPEPKSGSIEN